MLYERSGRLVRTTAQTRALIARYVIAYTPVLLVGIAATLVLMWGLGRASLDDWDEAIYAQISKYFSPWFYLLPVAFTLSVRENISTRSKLSGTPAAGRLRLWIVYVGSNQAAVVYPPAIPCARAVRGEYDRPGIAVT